MSADQTQAAKPTGAEPNMCGPPTSLSKANIYRAFGGSVFGCTLWLLILSVMAGDAISAVAVFAVAVAIFVLATRMTCREPSRYWVVAIAMLVALALLNLAVVNLRWSAWMEIYRQTRFYEPRNDVSLTTINLLIALIFGGLLLLFIILRARRNAPPQPA